MRWKLKRNRKELLEVNSTVTKNVFDGLIRELDTAEEIICELADRSIEISHIKI